MATNVHYLALIVPSDLYSYSAGDALIYNLIPLIYNLLPFVSTVDLKIKTKLYEKKCPSV